MRLIESRHAPLSPAKSDRQIHPFIRIQQNVHTGENANNERVYRVENQIHARLRRIGTARNANEIPTVYAKFNAFFTSCDLSAELH